MTDLRIIFMGTPEYATYSLQALIEADLKPVLCVSQPDKPWGRKQVILPTPVKELAVANNIPVLQPVKIKTAEFQENLADYRPDLIVTAAYGRILPQNILDLPRLGCINVHGSLLPRYRGASPVQQSIINGDEITGITILRMTMAMDAGDILRQASIPLKDEYNVATLMTELGKLGGSVLPGTIKDLVAGKISEIPQDETKATYVSLLDRSVGKIDFTRSARTIFNLVRGTDPWPGAYTGYNGKRLKIYRSHVIDTHSAEVGKYNIAKYFPGEILPAPKGELWVGTGDGILALDELQFTGGKRLDARDCAHNFAVGSRFVLEEN